YMVVTRYDVDGASARVWLDPAAETDPSVTAADAASVTAISYFGLRQASELGAALVVDGLEGRASFARVMRSPESTNAVCLERARQTLVLRWDGPLVLQGAAEIGGPFTNVPGATSPLTLPIGQRKGFFRLK